MNNKFISLATAAALLSLGFSACNKADVQSPDVNPSEMTTAYAKVAIYMPKGTSTRSDVTASEADEQFAAGTEEESIVKDIQLALYDDFDNYVGIGKLVTQMDPENADKPGRDDSNVSDTYEKIFKLTLSDGANDPTKVVAFINMDANTSNLNDLLTNGKVPASDYQTTDGFIMTNSGYYKGNEYVVAADIPVDAIYHDETKPSGKTVEIYVERLAAKITVNSEDPDQDDLNYVVNDVAGNEVKLEYTPKYWGATGTAQKENLVKTAFENDEPSWMNDANNNRSYWANGWNWGLTIEQYTTGNGKVKDQDDPLHYLTFGDLAGTANNTGMNAIGKSNYVLEHTSPLGIDKMNLIANTYAIVTGNYAVMQDESEHEWFKADEEGNVDFYLLLAGEKDGKKIYTIYTESQLIAYLLKWNGVEKIYTAETGGIELDVLDNTAEFAEYLTLGYNFEDNQYKLAAGTSSVYVDGETGRVVLDVTTLKKVTNSRHYCFPKGGAYFNVPIATNTTATVNTYGVVRNHSYVLNITEIKNLGAPLDENEFKKDPGDDPDPKPVVPDPDDFKDNFIKAKINVLSWHVIDNGVTL